MSGVVKSMTAIVVDEIAILSGAHQLPEDEEAEQKRPQWEWSWHQRSAWNARDCLEFDGVGDGIAHTIVVVPSFSDVDRVVAAKLVRPRGAIVVTAATSDDPCWNRVVSKHLQGVCMCVSWTCVRQCGSTRLTVWRCQYTHRAVAAFRRRWRSSPYVMRLSSAC